MNKEEAKKQLAVVKAQLQAELASGIINSETLKQFKDLEAEVNGKQERRGRKIDPNSERQKRLRDEVTRMLGNDTKA